MREDNYGCRLRLAAWLLVTSALLAACAGSRAPGGSRSGAAIGEAPPDAPAARAGARRGGGYYLDDGPGDGPLPDIAAIPDAVPRPEPVLARTSRPYVVFGREYRPMTELRPYRARGVATWYGRRYHGNPTSSGERYDMYAMTAAHPTLPIPSYARVTNMANGRSVVVRINDRGPFLSERLIDLSYTAAAKLDYVGGGSAMVEVESITDFDGWPAAGLVASSGAAQPSQPLQVSQVSQVSQVPKLSLASTASQKPQASQPAERAVAQAVGLSGSISEGMPVGISGSIPGSEAPAPSAVARVAAPPGTAAVGRARDAPRLPVAAVAAMDTQAAQPDPVSPERLTVETEIRPPDPAPGDSREGVLPALPGAPGSGTVSARGGGLVPVLERAFWLQLGAFGSQGNAHAARERLLRETSGLGAPLDIVADSGLYKLQAGPWPTREAAIAAGERLHARTGLKPFAIER